MQTCIIATTIAQAGAIGNQRRSSNLQRFESHDPPTLKEGGDSMVENHCFQLVRKDTNASGRGKKANLILASGRSRKLLLHTNLRDKAMATRAKAKFNHSRVGDTSRLLASQGREHVSIVTSLETLDRIAHRGRDPRVMRHHSPNHQWDLHRRSLFFLT